MSIVATFSQVGDVITVSWSAPIDIVPTAYHVKVERANMDVIVLGPFAPEILTTNFSATEHGLGVNEAVTINVTAEVSTVIESEDLPVVLASAPPTDVSASVIYTEGSGTMVSVGVPDFNPESLYSFKAVHIVDNVETLLFDGITANAYGFHFATYNCFVGDMVFSVRKVDSFSATVMSEPTILTVPMTTRPVSGAETVTGSNIAILNNCFNFDKIWFKTFTYPVGYPLQDWMEAADYEVLENGVVHVKMPFYAIYNFRLTKNTSDFSSLTQSHEGNPITIVPPTETGGVAITGVSNTFNSEFGQATIFVDVSNANFPPSWWKAHIQYKSPEETEWHDEFASIIVATLHPETSAYTLSFIPNNSSSGTVYDLRIGLSNYGGAYTYTDPVTYTIGG